MFCNHCGKEIPDGSGFCNFCGGKLNAITDVQSPVSKSSDEIKETHGTGPVHRQAGSMGACSSPSRIYKGKGMPGHMGAEQVTVQNLETRIFLNFRF